MTPLVVFDENNNRYTLLSINKSGGEGAIYGIQGKPYECAKIYHTDKITLELKNKIQAMVDNPPSEKTDQTDHHSMAWPTRLLYKQQHQKQFLGFIMPRADESFKEAHDLWDSNPRIKNFGGTFNYQYLLTAARNIASVVTAIHEKGHRIGDLSARNILIGPTALVTLIDCDSFQIFDKKMGKTYYCRVATPEFLSPELFDKNFGLSNIDRYYADLFSLGIIIFQLLMLGFHPYTSKGKLVQDAPTTVDKIKMGYFVYSGKCNGISPPPWAPTYHMISPNIQNLFERCFSEGHSNPVIRPMATEWFEALKNSQKRITTCKKNSNHKFFDHINYCPWCKFEKEHNNHDLFPLVKPTIRQPQPLTRIPSPIHPPSPPPHPISSSNNSLYVKIFGALFIILLVYIVVSPIWTPTVKSMTNHDSNSNYPNVISTPTIQGTIVSSQTTQFTNTPTLENADSIMQKGQNYLTKSDYSNAIASFNSAISIDSSKISAVKKIVMQMKTDADYLSDKGNDCSKAITIYDNVLKYSKLDGTLKEATMQKKLNCLQKLGRSNEADSLNLQIQREFYPEQYQKFL